MQATKPRSPCRQQLKHAARGSSSSLRLPRAELRLSPMAPLAMLAARGSGWGLHHSGVGTRAHLRTACEMQMHVQSSSCIGRRCWVEKLSCSRMHDNIHITADQQAILMLSGREGGKVGNYHYKCLNAWPLHLNMHLLLAVRSCICRGKALVRTRVEPKTFFANERTFLQWLQISVLIMFMGLSLLGGSSIISGSLSTTSCVSGAGSCNGGKVSPAS